MSPAIAGVLYTDECKKDCKSSFARKLIKWTLMIDNSSYDVIAQEYRHSKMLPFRRYIEEYSLFEMLGDIAGKNILDLACGEGIYSRKLKQLGARYVLGVDVSKEMIKLAKVTELAEPMNIDYLIEDVAKLGKIGEFDCIVASYLFNYARNEEELRHFCKVAYLNLKPGGLLVGINDSPMDNPKLYHSHRKYGYLKSANVSRHDGDKIIYTFFNPDGISFNVYNFYHSPLTYEKVFRTSGFSQFDWMKLNLSSEGFNAMPIGYWNDFLENPPYIGIKAVR